MNDQHVSDRDLKAAFGARAAGAPDPEIYERISAEAARTRQSRPLIVLPGFASQATTRLVWAAVLAALTVALIGVLAIGVGSRPFTGVGPTGSPTTSDVPVATPSGEPSVEPSPSVVPSSAVAPSPSPDPSVEPSVGPSVEPSASAPGAPTPSPFVPAELGPDRLGRVVATDGLRVRSLPTVGEESVRLEPTLDEGTPFYVVAGPELADGYAWYQISPYGGDPSLTPFGWVAAGSREGDAWIATSDLACDAIPASVEMLGTSDPETNLYCYGIAMPGEHELTGQLVCDFGDTGGGVSGADWIEVDRFCSLQAEDFTIEDGISIRIWGQAATGLLDEGSPVDGQYTVVGHFDDAGAGECVSADPETDPAEAVLYCRMQFVATEVRPADG